MTKLAMFVMAAVMTTQLTAARAQDYDFRAWGKEALEVIERDHATSAAGNYYEDQNRRNISFIWGKGKLLIAYANAARLEPEYHDNLANLIDSINRYWVEHEGIGGYDHLPHPRNHVGRYYDDNAWVAMGLIDAYEVLGNEQYISRAKETIDFALSGVGDSGGIYWREYRKDTYNTCSVAPTAYACLRYYQTTGDESYLDHARSLMQWLDANLRDDDALYFDNISTSGRIQRYKWTYNAGMPLQAYVLLYELTENNAYLEKARDIARSAENHWYDSETGAISCQPMFVWTLIEGWVHLADAAGEQHWKELAGRSVSFLYENVRDSQGRYPSRWDNARNGRNIRRWRLLYPVGAAKAYWVMAETQ